jgi:hypothetical protein
LRQRCRIERITGGDARHQRADPDIRERSRRDLARNLTRHRPADDAEEMLGEHRSIEVKRFRRPDPNRRQNDQQEGAPAGGPEHESPIAPHERDDGEHDRENLDGDGE